MTPLAAKKLISAFRGKHVIVVGDVMLDETIRGDVTRISPEAPVPVVELTERSLSPGGAANVTANVVSLSGRSTIVGLAGADAPGTSLRDAIRQKGIDTKGLVVTDDRPTTHKLRVVARTQQIVRVDVEAREPISASAEKALLDMIGTLADDADAFVLSDYAKGVVTPAVAQAVMAAAKRRGVPVICDPKGRDFAKYVGATVITPNVLELEVATGISTHNVDGAVVEAGRRLLPELGGAALLVTRGARGMTLLDRDLEPIHVPAVARAVYDVTGAGDTVVGALALALATRAPWSEALVIASQAAGIAVARAGTVAVSASELDASFDD